MNKTTTAVPRAATARALSRQRSDIDHQVESYRTRKGQNIHHYKGLKLVFLGGLRDIGEKNMAVIEYGDHAVVLDCGMNLSVDLPGINYEINHTAYLHTIRHKIKAYLITHGHLDHIGGLKHTVPDFPALIYASRYSCGIIAEQFKEMLPGQKSTFKPDLRVVDIDNQERLSIGPFGVEFVRVTHALPEPAAICIDTPEGRIIATGDFRLDPEPLDRLPTNVTRLKQLGDEGVLLLLSDSSYADTEGRVPTEHTLQPSFQNLIQRAEGRVIVAVFSSNINRIQMIIDAAVADGRKVALDGRSMLTYSEIAVRQGLLKIPKGSVVSMQQAVRIPHDQLLIMCTGGQGEPNAALQRMSSGQHRHITLQSGDTVVVSSSPIPGNEVSYDAISSQLVSKGVQLFRHPTHQVDGCGPLHVSGHARRDELREMIRLVRPKFFVPVHGGMVYRAYHAQLAEREGVPKKHILLPDNGAALAVSSSHIKELGTVPHGSQLVDDSGQIVHKTVIEDRLRLSSAGLVGIILGGSPRSIDIISRGFIHLDSNAALLRDLRHEVKRVATQRYGRVADNQFRKEASNYLQAWLYGRTSVLPMVYVGVKSGTKPTSSAGKSTD